MSAIPSVHYSRSNLQSSYDTACDQGFKPADDDVYNGRNPDELPAPPLDNAGPKRNNKVDNTKEEKSPEDGKAPYICGIVQVVRLSSPKGKRPVQGRKRWGFIALGSSAPNALDKATCVSRTLLNMQDTANLI